MTKKLPFLFLFILAICQNGFSSFIGGDDTPSSVVFSLEECLSNSTVPGSEGDYSEFTATTSNASECAELSVIGGNLYRLNPAVNMHSCSPGVNNSTAMCVGINTSCTYSPGSDEAIRFDISLSPKGEEAVTMTGLSFYENAPTTFNWINGPSGPNNYPTFYGIRVLVNGVVIFEESEISTENEWNLEEYDFASLAAFTVNVPTTFNFELLPYCPIGNGATVAAWDVDEITVKATCVPVDGGLITLEDGSLSATICSGNGEDDLLNTILSEELGDSFAWVITDADGNILGLPTAPPFNFEEAGAGTCYIWHLAYIGTLTGLDMGNNVSQLEGCYDFSNSLEIIRQGVNGGEISVDGLTEFEICAGDGIPDPLSVTLSGEEGEFSGWIITDSEGNILGLPSNPPFDLEEAGEGTCLIWHIAYFDGLVGLEVGLNAAELDGCFDLSNPITVVRNGVNGGDLELLDGGTEITICAGDGISDAFDINLINNFGQNMGWIITDSNGNILGLPTSSTFDLEGAGSGICLIWNIAYYDGLSGLEVGLNAAELIGCFDLSNPITVTREGVNGGELAIEGGATEISICAGDGIPDAFDITLTATEGEFTAWIITDTSGNILALPAAPPFDLDGAGAGICLIWNLAYADGLSGLEIGLNASELEGCFDLSNPITVIRDEVGGGVLAFADGTDIVEICAGDGIADPLDVVLTGQSSAESQWLITDANGNILGLPMAPPFDLEGAGGGTCLIWNLSYGSSFSGAEIGMNAAEFEGCFSLSNPLTVIRNGVNGGELSLTDSTTQITICADDGVSDTFEVTLTGIEGANSAWVITDVNGIILDLPSSLPFEFEGTGSGVCLLWHLSFEDGLQGAVLGENANNLIGCFDLSNPIVVTRLIGDNCDIVLCEAEGGTISFADGGSTQTICVGDLMSDSLDVILTGNIGSQSQWVITDTDGLILDLPASPPFDLDDAVPGTCLIWHLSYEPGIMGLSVGNNAFELTGCFEFSNAITVEKVSGDDCDQIGCEVVGGIIGLAGSGDTEITICVGDTMPDLIDATLMNNIGDNSQWVLTNINGTILGLPGSLPVDLDDAGSGICLLWHLSYDGILDGLEIDSNANNLSGCFDFSNAIIITRVSGPACDNIGCDANGGNLSFADGSTDTEICAGDSIPDPLEVILTGNIGELSGWIITNTNGIILGLPSGPPFDLDDAGAGTCLIWHISYSPGLVGLEVGLSALALDGCFSLSNPISVIRYSGGDCDLIGCEAIGGTIQYLDSTTNQVTLCVGDGIDDFVDVNLSGNTGTNSQWVITDNTGTILSLPLAPPFNFEGAGQGICLIWHLSYEDGITGLEIDSSASNLSGCYSLSNSLTVIRNGVNGGEIIFDTDTTELSICVGDGISDSLTVNLSGVILGDSTIWVLTDDLGNIQGIQNSPIFDLEGSEAGVCLIWHLAYNDTIVGLEIGSNANNLVGCFDLSNPLTVNKDDSPNCIPGLIPDKTAEIAFTLGPNPATSQLNIQFQSLPYANSVANIYNAQGMIIGSYNTVTGETIIVDVNNFNTGIYFVQVISGNKLKSKKFIKIN